MSPALFGRVLDLLAAHRVEVRHIGRSQDELTELVEAHMPAFTEISEKWARTYGKPEDAR